jgi:hypothetical protein
MRHCCLLQLASRVHLIRKGQCIDGGEDIDEAAYGSGVQGSRGLGDRKGSIISKTNGYHARRGTICEAHKFFAGLAFYQISREGVGTANNKSRLVAPCCSP